MGGTFRALPAPKETDVKPAPFVFEQPTTLQAALVLLGDGRNETKILAGGQSLVPMMNRRMARPERLIDINALRELDYIRREGEELAIGALTRHAQVKGSTLVRACAPIIPAAYEWVAHGPVRNRGTLAGNLCHADPSAEMPSVMLALNATFVVRSIGGQRRIGADAFFRGIHETALEHDEMLVEVRVPICSLRQGWGFHEVSLRKGDFAYGCACALMTVAGGVIASVAVGAAGIADRALRLSSVEAALVGREPSAARFVEAVKLATDKVEALEDSRGQAEYRSDLIRILAKRALQDASDRAKH
jgi:carbon-monoxide dehydrogenase medium subunit